jgi:hypothetical protein
MKLYFYFFRFPVRDEDNIYTFCIDTSFECDFDSLFEKCLNSTSYNKNGVSDLKEEDIVFFLRWVQYIMNIILYRIFAFMAMVNNILIVYVIKNKAKKKIFNDPMYIHAQINAILNIFYCVLVLVSLISSCVDYDVYESNAFCSSIYMNEATQYFKIICVYFLNSAIRTCANMSYMFFSLSRFILVANFKERAFFKKFSKVNIKIYIALLVLFGILMNLFRLFQFTINTNMERSEDFPFETITTLFCYDAEQNRCRFFDSLKLTNEIINDVLLFFLNILIDISLIYHFNKDIDHKMKIRAQNADNSDLVKSKKYTNRMVVLSGLVFFLSSFPQFAVLILNFVFRGEFLDKFCFTNLYYMCNLFDDLAQFFSIFTMLFQFYIFLIFNKNFRESFNDKWTSIKQRIFKKRS